jgi:hypothetical protein
MGRHEHRSLTVWNELDLFVTQYYLSRLIREFHLSPAERNGAYAIFVNGAKDGGSSISVTTAHNLRSPSACDLDREIFPIKTISLTTLQIRKDQRNSVRFKHRTIPFRALSEHKRSRVDLL